MKRVILFLVLFSCLFISACSDGGAEVTNKPDSSVNISSFTDIGCEKGDWSIDCSKVENFNEFDCSKITTDEYIKALSPELPILKCWRVPKEYSESERGIITDGCMFATQRAYVVISEGSLKLIKNKEDFKAVFAPVESRKEAISFAAAFTKSEPRYSAEPPESYRKKDPNLLPTYSEEVPEGYKVLMFEQQICGCSRHHYYAVEYLVTKEGDVKELSRKVAFESIDNAEICID